MGMDQNKEINNTNSIPSHNNDSSVIYNNIVNDEQHDEIIDLD